MNKKIWASILKAPALLLLIASFLAGIYAAVYNIQEMGWEVPIILGIVLLLYGIGSRMEKKFYQESSDETSTPIERPTQTQQVTVPEADDELEDDEEEEGFS